MSSSNTKRDILVKLLICAIGFIAYKIVNTIPF
jgi:hypothetical protein